MKLPLIQLLSKSLPIKVKIYPTLKDFCSTLSKFFKFGGIDFTRLLLQCTNESRGNSIKGVIYSEQFTQLNFRLHFPVERVTLFLRVHNFDLHVPTDLEMTTTPTMIPPLKISRLIFPLPRGISRACSISSIHTSRTRNVALESIGNAGGQNAPAASSKP